MLDVAVPIATTSCQEAGEAQGSWFHVQGCICVDVDIAILIYPGVSCDLARIIFYAIEGSDWMLTCT